jgi:hypothetical protein
MVRSACACALVVLIALPFTQPFAAVDASDFGHRAGALPLVTVPASVATPDGDATAMSDSANPRLTPSPATSPALWRLQPASPFSRRRHLETLITDARSDARTVLRI